MLRLRQEVHNRCDPNFFFRLICFSNLYFSGVTPCISNLAL
ncbi:hypothetical protein BLL52_1512 [Rhodoferax antarcticus ANT.BR]|uniref:Uncharacterized protein n=1 Tax=Rhodoferax antarcticus ANT.BR TaxID=1111071 RepID=A0A1Q8YGV9_9BURK|nr:hypothetical protein BLL52_1512 [Rhodoferax antarcticus ANT.BR]